MGYYEERIFKKRKERILCKPFGTHEQCTLDALFRGLER